MKVLVLFTLFCFAVYYSDAEHVTNWGNCSASLLLGRERIFVKAQSTKIRTKIIKFPLVRISLKKNLETNSILPLEARN